MNRWRNKTAVVTGGGSGIGAACCRDLIEAGLKVVALDVQINKLQEVKESLPRESRSNFHILPCDVTDEEDVIKTFKLINETSGGIHVLVNSAGIFNRTKRLVSPDNSKDMEAVLRTNVLGVMYCTRETFQIMKAANIDGHVVILNSLTGHTVHESVESPLNIYPASKHAVKAMTEVYRQEFSRENTNIRISSISPSLVKTNMVGEYANNPDTPALDPEDVSSAVMFCISRPPKVQIHDIIMRPLHERA